jgi:hypothetical protein
MEKDELRARLDDIIKNASAPSIDERPDAPRYSLMTNYPAGVFKASDLYLWLDRLLKISRVRTIRESPTGFTKPVEAQAKTARIPVAGVSKPTAPTKEEVMAALKKKKAEKPVEKPKESPKAKEIAPKKPAEKTIEKVVEKPGEETIEMEAPAPRQAPKGEIEEAEIEVSKEEKEEMEIEVESKGEIGPQISLEEMKKKDEEETVTKAPSERGVGLSYIDAHVNPKVELPDMVTEDIDSRSSTEISNISESVGPGAYQDKIEITRRLLELTKLKISEKNLDTKKKIDSEIMLLKGRMKTEKAKTSSDLPAMVSGHFSEELESMLGNLESSIDLSMKELKSRYESAKVSASGDQALLAKINTQFIKDSNILAEQTSETISKSKSFLMNLHSKEIDAAVAKGIFTKERADIEKSAIAKDYPSRFNALLSKAEQVRQVKEEVSKSSFSETVKEISAMREAELLHELSARDRKTFLSYIKGELSKTDAIIMAKRSVAKEREIPEDAINQFFPQGGNK